MEKFYIPILGSEGFILYLKHKREGRIVAGASVASSSVIGVAIVTSDGKTYHFIHGQKIPEIDNAIDCLLRGNLEYGDPSRFGVHGKVLTLKEASDLKIPDITKPCVFLDWQETMGSNDPRFHISGTQLLLQDEVSRWLIKNYNGHMRHKVLVTNSDGKKIILQKALGNLQEGESITLKYEESSPTSKLPNIVTQTIRFK